MVKKDFFKTSNKNECERWIRAMWRLCVYMAEGGEDALAQLIVYTQISKEVFNTLPEIEPDTT